MSNSLVKRAPYILSKLEKIDIKDIPNVERDLSFYEMVSLGFLLFGNQRKYSFLVLQELLRSFENRKYDLLKIYAANVNPNNWRLAIVEALTFIGCRRVLRKLGLQWKELHEYFLPHIPELNFNIHPILKTLYKICDDLAPGQAEEIIVSINGKYKAANEHLRFYDSAYMEIFLLHWINLRIINIDNGGNTVDLKVLLEYLKLNDMETLKEILQGAINHCAKDEGSDNKIKLDSVLPEPTNSTNLQTISPTKIDPINRYIVRRDNAGIALIINQKNFHMETDETCKDFLPKKVFEKRRGTDLDKASLSKVFVSFGYKIEEFDDLKHKDMLNCIREVVKKSIHRDSLVVCILTHGSEGVVYGCNSVPVKIAEVEEIIADESLQDKPKILIIQACQKESEDTVLLKKNIANTPYAYADMIKAMSTFPGYDALRHTKDGSWYIQALCQALDELGDKEHFMDILTTVTNQVSNKRGEKNEVMLPHTSCTLRKKLFFPCRL